MECFAPLDPTRTYRITVWPGDAVYLSLTVYGGPNDGRYSERIVGTANSRDTAPGLDGSIRIVVSPELPSEAGVAWIKLEPDAVAAITRDYLNHPTTGRRATWSKTGQAGGLRLHQPRELPHPGLLYAGKPNFRVLDSIVVA